MAQGMPPSYPMMPGAQPPQFPTGQAVPQASPPGMVASLPAPQPRAIRGVRGEDPVPEVRPTRLALPAPEQMGIAVTNAANGPAKTLPTATEQPLDWSAVHRRLDAHAVTCFQIEQEQAGWRVVCLQSCCCTPGKHHRIETHGSSQAEAVRLALEQVERPGCK